MLVLISIRRPVAGSLVPSAPPRTSRVRRPSAFSQLARPAARTQSASRARATAPCRRQPTDRAWNRRMAGHAGDRRQGLLPARRMPPRCHCAVLARIAVAIPRRRARQRPSATSIASRGSDVERDQSGSAVHTGRHASLSGKNPENPCVASVSVTFSHIAVVVVIPAHHT